MDKLTNLQQLRAASLEAKGMIGEVAGAAAEAIEELDSKKQEELNGTKGQVVGFGADGRAVAQSGFATEKYVNDLVGDIASILDSINGEVA